MPDLEYQGEPWVRQLDSTGDQMSRCEHMTGIGFTTLVCAVCGPLASRRFDGNTGRPLAKLTPEELQEHVQRTIEANQQWLRDHVWWRRWTRRVVEWWHSHG